MPDIKDLKETFETAASEMKNLVSRQSEEIEKCGETTRQTAEAINKADARLHEISAEIEEKEKRITELEKKMNRPGFGGQAEKKTLGDLFTESDSFINRKGFDTGVVEFDRKAITNANGSAGQLIQPTYDNNIYKDPARSPRIKDLCMRIPVNSDSVTVYRRGTRTNSAAPQAGQNVAKAESGTVWSQESLSVQTIANYIVASRQILSDVGQLRALIDADLIENLGDEMDDQILYGDGTGQNFTGIMVDTDVPTVGEITTGTTGTAIARAMLNHVRSAITTVQTANYRNINPLILHPEDWETLETAVGTDGHYIWTNVATSIGEQIWRIPVIVTAAMTQGDFILGDLARGVKYYDREVVSVRMSEYNGTDFIKNALTILAEERGVVAVTLPNALCKGSFDVAAS